MKEGVAEKLEQMFEKLLLEIDQKEIKEEVNELRRKNPTLTNEQLAEKMTRSAALKAASTGAVSGAAGGPIGLIAMGPDIFNLVRQQSRLIFALGFLYGREPNRPERVKEVIATLAVSTGAAVARKGVAHMIEQGLGKKVVQKIVKKLAGRLVARKLPTIAPIAGGFIGGGVNYLAVRSVGRVAAKYYTKEAPL